jgi:hypothetical protein
MRKVIALLMLTSLVGVGCERTISSRETVKQHRDGTVTKSTEKVKEEPDGTIRVEKERQVNP